MRHVYSRSIGLAVTPTCWYEWQVVVAHSLIYATDSERRARDPVSLSSGGVAAGIPQLDMADQTNIDDVFPSLLLWWARHG